MAKLSINLRDNRVVRYFRETWFELKKISWPSRAEAINLTVMVIVVTTFLSLVLSLMDYGFQSLFALIVR